MYHFIFIILLLASTYEFFSESSKKIGIYLFFMLLIFVTLRYGQGSDYFNYIYLFTNSSEEFERLITNGDFGHITTELGFSIISFIWLKLFNLTPESLSALYSAVSFILIWLFIKKYSVKPILSLFIFYCTFYLIYPFSGIRQGLCISIFIYYAIPHLQNKNYLKYYLWCFLLFSIHFSSIILFVLPVVNLLKNYNLKQVTILSIAALGVGVVLSQLLFSFFATLDLIGGKVGSYTQSSSFDILSLMLRVVIFVPIVLTYHIYERNSIRELFLKIYILGFLLYLVFMSSALISSRINVYMRYFEIIMLVDVLQYLFLKKTNKVIGYAYIVTLMTFLYVKNINSFIDQGSYYSHVNFYNYPYITFFEKDKVQESRYIEPYFRTYIIYD